MKILLFIFSVINFSWRHLDLVQKYIYVFFLLFYIYADFYIFQKNVTISFFLSYVGKTSNVHALRMVGTLQDETDRLRIECETLKHEVQQLKTNVAIKNAEQDRWIEER